MRDEKYQLLLGQVDRRIADLSLLKQVDNPKVGWIHTIRKALKMTLKQLAKRMGISPQSVKEMENREKLGTVTLKTMNDIASALDMRFIYVILPKEESLQKMIEKRALEIAQDIVKRTSVTMKLEDQEISEERLQSAIRERAVQIQNEMPGYLWD